MPQVRDSFPCALAGGYAHPGLENPVETTQGIISESEFTAADGGRYSLSHQHLTAMLEVDYVMDGRPRSLNETVSIDRGIGAQVYSADNPITVYIRRDKVDSFATLAKPKPLILIWIGMSVFGTAWMILGWLVGRPVGSDKGVDGKA